MWPWAQQLNLWFPEGSGEPVPSVPFPAPWFSLTSSSPSLCSSHLRDVGVHRSGRRACTLDPGFAKDLLWDPRVSGPGEASSSPVRGAGERALIPSGSHSLPRLMLSPRKPLRVHSRVHFCSQLLSCGCCKA